MKIFSVPLITLFMISLTAFAQKKPIFHLTTVRYNFQQIYESNGVVTCSFDFGNEGNDTLKISKIKTSAPTVTAEAKSGVLAPGAESSIVVKFDPAGSSGRIDRFISIRTNDPDYPIKQISIGADVVAKEKVAEDNYPIKSGSLRFKAKHLAFDNFENTEIRKDTFFLYNSGSQTITFEPKEIPAYLKLDFKPAELKAKSQGFAVLTYDAGKSGNWGLTMNSLKIMTNDSLEAEKTLTVGVNIVEDFSYLDNQKEKKVPVMEYAATEHDFGKVKAGQLPKFDFVFTNKGNADLIIRKTKASCGCTTSEPDKSVLKPGESGKITVTFNTAGMQGKQSKGVTVVCNDPAKPVTMISITADIVE